MCEPHLDLLALAPRLLEGLGPGEGTRNITSGFVLIAWNLAKWDLRTALGSEFATVAVVLSGQIEKCGSAIHECPGRRQGLTRGTMVDVACRIISKVATREGAVISLRPVEHRDMWRDVLLLDQSVQHRSRPIGGIGREALRL